MKTDNSDRSQDNAEWSRLFGSPISLDPVIPEDEVAIRDFDFIQNYIAYADVLEVPPDAHEAVALLMLAVAINGRVYFHHGIKKVSFDLWLLLLSESSMGRNYLVDDIARPVLQKAGLDHLVHNAVWGSSAAVYQQIADQPVGLFIWPELSIILKKFQEQQFAGVQQWITDLRDGNVIPPSIRYRVTRGRRNTPPIVFHQPPRISILSSSSTDWFLGSLKQEDTTGGFIPRWTIIFLPKSDRCIPIPLKTDESRLDILAEHLKRVTALEGEADFDDCIQAYIDWYPKAKERFEKHPNAALAGPFFRRLRTQVLQFAVLCHLSENANLRIGRSAMERAIQIATKIEQGIFRMLPTGMTVEGHEIERMAELIREGGPAGATKTAVTLAFKNSKPRDRKDRLETLIDSGTVVQFYREGRGRPATVYVHEDYLTEHEKRYPGDKVPGAG